MRKNQERSVLLPSLGSIGLAAPIIPLTSIDSTLKRNGLGRDLIIDPASIKRVEKFVSLTPGSVPDSSLFFPEYVERASEALSSPLWSNRSGGYTMADVLNDSQIIRSAKNANKDSRAFRMFGPLRGTILKYLSSMTSNADQYTAAEKANDFIGKSLASHFLGTSGSYDESYRRLMSETMGLSTPQGKTPEFLAIRRKGSTMAEDLYEAITNHTNPTRTEFNGKSFATASDYLDNIWANNRKIGGLSQVPGTYRNALNIAEGIVNTHPGKDNAIRELAKLLGGESNFYMRSVLPRIGTPARFEPATENGFEKLIKSKDGTIKSLTPRSKDAAIDLAKNDLAMAIAHGDATRLFAGATTGHKSHLDLAKRFNLLQKIRNPVIRASLGVGALGLGGLGIYNAKMNSNYRKSILGRIRKAIGIG